jgi:hypothetical protein
MTGTVTLKSSHCILLASLNSPFSSLIRLLHSQSSKTTPQVPPKHSAPFHFYPSASVPASTGNLLLPQFPSLLKSNRPPTHLPIIIILPLSIAHRTLPCPQRLRQPPGKTPLLTIRRIPPTIIPTRRPSAQTHRAIPWRRGGSGFPS